jgi:exosortase A
MTAVSVVDHGRYSWVTALCLLTLSALATVALLWPSALSISHIWLNSETYQHGMIIVPLAVFLAWTRRHQLALIAPRPSAWGLAWLALAGLAWVLARSVDVKLVQHFALVAMLPGLVITLLGVRAALILIFPLGFVFFAVPFGDFIVPKLQDYTAWFSVQMLRLSGLPVYQDGYYISIPRGNFVVAEVCSGVRYLIASLALGLVYADLSYRSVWRRLALVALAIALPIIANGIRAYGIIMIAHWTNMEYAVGVDHLIYGWLFFGLVMVLLFWLGSLWWEKQPASDQPAVVAKPVAAPLSRRAMTVILVLMAVILVAPRGGDLWLTDRAARIAVASEPRLPTDLPNWQGPQPASGVWQPQYHDAHAEQAGLYHADDSEVELHLYHYLNQGDGSEIVSYRNRIYDGRVWRRSAERAQLVTSSTGQSLRVHETVLSGPGGSRLVWHWYQIGEHATIHRVEVKLREAEALLRGDGRGSLLVAVSAAGGHSPEALRAALEPFIAELPLEFGLGD